MKSRWKGLELDYEALSAFDTSVLNIICLNQRQIAILKGLLLPAYWATRWQNLTATRDELEADIAELEYLLDVSCDEGPMLKFQDNPLDTCEVQYSTDNGATWMTMFRKDNCDPGWSTEEIDKIYNDIDTINNNNTTYAGDIRNVAPQWEYASELNDRALCYAISAFVDMVCKASIDAIITGNVERRNEHEWLDKLEDALSVGIVTALVLLAGPVTLPTLALTAVSWAVTRTVDAKLDALVSKSPQSFENEEAKDTIKCTIYNAMKGKTPLWTDWTGALSYHSSFGGDEYAIADAVYEYMTDLDVFVNYLILMEDINSVAASLPVCDCPTRWEHHWDFVDNGLEYWTINGEYGEYIPGLGVRATLRLLSGYYSNLIEQLSLGDELPEVIPRCDGWEFHMTCIRGTWDANLTSLYMLQPPRPVYTANSGFIMDGTPGWRQNFALADLENVELGYIRSCYTQAGTYGEIVITGMTLYGEGTDPFAGRDTD